MEPGYYLNLTCENTTTLSESVKGQAFKTPLGQFKYLVMQFGLTNAPAMFQAVFVFVYLNDIPVFSRSLEEHGANVSHILTRLLLKAEKCQFHTNSIHFLRLIIQSWSIKVDPEKIRASLCLTSVPLPHRQFCE